MRTNYLLKADVYAITDLLGCGDDNQTNIGNHIMMIIDEIMEYTDWDLRKIIGLLQYNYDDNCIWWNGNGLSKDVIDLYFKLELWFYRWYFANVDILDIVSLLGGLEMFRECFDENEYKDSFNYDDYAYEYADEKYVRNYIM